MKNSLLHAATALAILILLSSTVPAQETYNLQYKFEKGKTYLYDNNLTSAMTQEVMGKETKVNSSIHSVIRFNIDNVAGNGDIQLTSSLDSASVKYVAMGKENSLDLTDMIGKRVKAVISNIGEIKSCAFIDSIADQSSKMMPLTQEVKNFFVKLAGKAIKINENWTSTDVDTVASLGNGVTNSSEISYTLAGKENKGGHDCYKIPSTGKLKLSGKANVQGMDFTIEGDGTTTGIYYLDINSGLLIFSEISMNFDMTMATSGQQSMVIPITQSLKYTRSLIKN